MKSKTAYVLVDGDNKIEYITTNKYVCRLMVRNMSHLAIKHVVLLSEYGAMKILRKLWKS